MNFFTFLRRLFATEDRLDKRARLRSRTLLRLEALEDRIVPTTTNIFTVTSTGDGSSAGGIPGTLRWAVAQADLSANSADTNIINFNLTSTGASPYTIDLGRALNLTNNMTIQGLGANTLFISGNNASSVFTIGAGANVELDNLTIENGAASATDTTFGSGLGGGIYNQGNLTINNSTLSGNSANEGGGIFNESGATVSINNSTLSDNSATYDGGGIYNDGTANIGNSTLSDNSTTYNGGGIFDYSSSTANVGNSIVAQNNATNGADLYGPFISQGYNLIGIEDSSASGFTNGSKGDIVGTATAPEDPKLGALGNNGGPTQTMALLPGSPAIGSGSNTLIPRDPSTGSAYTTDQRGSGYARIAGSNVDIGAFEVQHSAPTVSVTDDNGAYNGKPFPASGTALGVDGKTPVNGTFNYAYYTGSSATGTPSATAPSLVGTYTVVATFSSSDTNYTGGTAQTTFTIYLGITFGI